MVVFLCLQVSKKLNYKASHRIGSRKVSEKCVSYSDTFPVYKSLVLAYIKDQDMKSQSSSKTGSDISKLDSHDKNSTKDLPLNKKSQLKEFVQKNSICCFVKLSTKSTNKMQSSKSKCKEPCLKTNSTTKLSKLPDKNSKFVSCKKHSSEQNYLSSKVAGNKSKQSAMLHDKNSSSTQTSNTSKNKTKSIERKMCVKRKLEVLSCKLEENNNTVVHEKPVRKKTASKNSKPNSIKKGKAKQDTSIIPGKRKKREASLNASALVNIYFEKESISPKKLKLSTTSGSLLQSDVENYATCVEESKVDNSKRELDNKIITSNDKSTKIETLKKSSKTLKLKEITGKKKMQIKQKENSIKINPEKSKLEALKENVKNKMKPSKSLDLKKIKQKLNNIGKLKNHLGCLNAENVKSTSKQTKSSTECAARTDRFCLSWVRQPFPQHHYQNKAQWVEGWGQTCCTVAANTNPETTLLVSQPTQQQLYEDSKSSSVSMPMTTPSHLQPPHGLGNIPRYDAASLSQMEPAQVIHIEPVQKLTHMEPDIASEDRPSSVVDVVGAHTPTRPMSRQAVCIKSVYPQDSTCVPPCSGYCCSSERFLSGQYQSMTLGGIGSISTMQMMSYPQPPYRSAFSVPYAHAGLQSYGKCSCTVIIISIL